jgi:hypothetical protein
VTTPTASPHDGTVSRLPRTLLVALVALVAGATIVGIVLVGRDRPGTGATPDSDSSPPRASGYFATLPPGSWSDLPDDEQCAARVHRSLWEPRPDNARPNGWMPNVERVHAAFAARPRARLGTYDPRWDTWLLPRVTGHHTGTTDENIQWAACKWGVADNVLRAIAVRESSWFQYEVYPNRRCVLRYGCGDIIPSSTPASDVYCSLLARRGRDYTADFGPGRCPRTFSIVGVMSWQDPAWGRFRGNQNGTFPFARRSTAFALDYLGAFLRGCDEGWVHWLGTSGPAYRPGDLWGCVGVWYSGAWWTPEARRYVDLVRSTAQEHPWLDPGWADHKPSCSPDFGCPFGGP